jgi:hypothetical protein
LGLFVTLSAFLSVIPSAVLSAISPTVLSAISSYMGILFDTLNRIALIGNDLDNWQSSDQI